MPLRHVTSISYVETPTLGSILFGCLACDPPPGPRRFIPYPHLRRAVGDRVMTAIDISNYAGLLALALLTTNILLGLLITTKYSPVRRWPHRRINTVRWHSWTGYAALAISAFHPAALLFSATAGFGIIDLLWPIGAPKQPVVNTFGALAFYALLMIIVTSALWQARKLISRRVWKRFHFLTYALFPLYAVHAFLTDPALKDRATDPLDAEKVFVEICILAVLAGIVVRLRWQRRQPPAGAPRTGSERGTRTDAALMGIILAATCSSVAAPAISHAQSSAAKHSGWTYDPDVGPTYERGNLSYSVWGFAERYWGPHSAIVAADFWRRARFGMQLALPATARVRAVAFYEADLTNTSFFRSGRPTRVFENAYVALQNADDPRRGRVLFGENTHVLSREDNLSSSNLPTINRSLVLEEHGSVNSFGTQWGVQASRAFTRRLSLAVAAQDGRGSLNTARPRYYVGNSLSAKLTSAVVDDSGSARLLVTGVGVDVTRHIGSRTFVLASALGGEPLGGVPAAGDKTTFEGDVAFTTRVAGHRATFEGEALASRFSATQTVVGGGYMQLQVSLFDTPTGGDLDPFVRYDIVLVRSTSETAVTPAAVSLTSTAPEAGGAVLQQAIRCGLNYNLPHARKFVGAHAELAINRMSGAAMYRYSEVRTLVEIRVGLRVNAARYLRH